MTIPNNSCLAVAGKVHNQSSSHNKKHNFKYIVNTKSGQTILSDNLNCIVCKYMCKLGMGKNHFKNHLWHQTINENRSHESNCHNYLYLTAAERLEFLQKANLCQFCIMPLNKHELNPCNKIRESRKSRFCIDSSCEKRVENCDLHSQLNQNKIGNKRAFLAKAGITFNM